MASSPPQSIDGLFDGALRQVLLWLSAKRVAAVSATSHAWRATAQAVIQEMHGALVDPVAVACLVSPDMANDRASAATMDAAVRRLTADLRWLPQVLICFFGRDNSWSDSQAGGGPDSTGEGPVVPNTFESCRALLPPGVIVVGCGADGVVGMDCDGQPREMYPEPLHDDEEEGERYFAGASVMAIRSAAAAPPPQLLALSEMRGFGSRRPPSFVAWDGLSLLGNFGMPPSPPVVSTAPPPPPSPPEATAAVSSASRSPKRLRTVCGRKCKLTFGDVLQSWLGRRREQNDDDDDCCERLHFVLTARARNADAAIEHFNALSSKEEEEAQAVRCANSRRRRSATAEPSVVVGGVVSGSRDLYAGVTPAPPRPISNSSVDDVDAECRGSSGGGAQPPIDGTAEGGKRLEHAVSEATIVLLTLFASPTREEQQNHTASRSASSASSPPPFSCSASTSSQAAAAASGGVGSGGGAVRAVCIEDGAGAHSYESQCHGALAAAGVWTAEIHEKAQTLRRRQRRRRERHAGTAGGDFDFGRPPIDQGAPGSQLHHLHRGGALQRLFRPRFGLVSACCERGPPFHGAANVEAEVHGRLLPGTTLAGFFAGGEIGPPPKQDTNHTAEVGEDDDEATSALFYSFTNCMGFLC